MYYTINYNSPVGEVLIASDEKSIVGLWIEGQKHFCHSVKGPFTKNHSLPILQKTVNWLDLYFTGKNPDGASLQIAPIGGEFRQLIWQLIRDIPYGKVTTYSHLAREAAKRMGRETMSAQAVGGAVGHNPISIIIPCHRVIGADGSLTGYAGGVHKKAQLLTLEGVDTANQKILNYKLIY